MSEKIPIEILGVRFEPLSRSELLQKINERIASRQKTLILSGNVHGLNLAYQTPWIREIYNAADFVRIDGAGLRLGARLLGKEIPERMTWADFAWDLCAVTAANGHRLFFLGGKPGVADSAAEQLRRRYPAVVIVGTHHGYFDHAPGSAESRKVLARIAAARPDILVVGMGMPLQEQWIRSHYDEIAALVTMSGGAVFDYLAGEVDRAPRWMTENGLEWLGRMLIEPRRLWKRYIIGNPLFISRILRQRFNLLRFPPPEPD